MKIIVNSRFFGKTIKKFFTAINDEVVDQVFIRNNSLVIQRENYETVIECEFKSDNQIVHQKKARWDWLIKTLNQIDEQPVVLEFHENKVLLRLDY